jgi:hypothetical protein
MTNYQKMRLMDPGMMAKALALIERHILKRNGVPEDNAVREDWAEFLNYPNEEEK